MKAPWIQISVDAQDVPTGLGHVDHAMAIDAEWIEVGTPLLTFAGIGSIGEIAKHAPGKTIRVGSPHRTTYPIRISTRIVYQSDESRTWIGSVQAVRRRMPVRRS